MVTTPPGEPILAEYLEWKIIDGGVMIEINSEQYDFVIDTSDMLFVYRLDSDELLAKRQCADIDHAQFIAKAFEIVSVRNHQRGCDWWGKPWNGHPKEGK